MRAAGVMRRGQRLGDVTAAARARASPEGRRGRRVPGRQGAVLLGRWRQPPDPAARRLARRRSIAMARAAAPAGA